MILIKPQKIKRFYQNNTIKILLNILNKMWRLGLMSQIIFNRKPYSVSVTVTFSFIC